MQNLHATGGQWHINCSRVAASHMQIVLAWLPVACNMNKIDRNMHATGGHAGTICMRLAVTQVQYACDWRLLRYTLHGTGGHSVTRQETSRQEVCKRPSLHHSFIIGKSTFSMHASDYSADGPWIFDLENALELWMRLPHGGKFCTC
jgi:hypothetical protein